MGLRLKHGPGSLGGALGVALVVSPLAIAEAQSRDAYVVEPVEHGAVLTGRVVFDGPVPRARRFLITKDIEVCGMGYRERQEVDVSERMGLRNVVIVIDGITRGKPWPDVPDGFSLTQENCVFAPHVQVVPRGAELNILNPDPVLHNIHSFEAFGSSWRTLFNFGQPPEEDVITTLLRPRRGNHIRLECDAHDFMLGWIYAADTPYAVAVDADGRFRLDEIPPGTYTLRAWHPYLGVREQRITFDSDGLTDTVFTF
jgi:hypothetical protein